jgi:phage major head subunit gpT-like protein
MYDDIYIYVPVIRQIIRIAEGTGDNLLHEDRAEGYVDYIYYEQHALETDLPEVDGGQVMLTELFRDKYVSTEKCIPDVLNMAFGDRDLSYVIL